MRCLLMLQWVMLLTLFMPSMAHAGLLPIDDKKDTTLVYDAVPIRVTTDGYQDFFLEAFYTNRKTLFIDVQDFFRTLRISCSLDPRGNVLNGFIGEEKNTYSIDFETKQIKVANKTVSVPNGLIKDQGIVYMESSLFTQTFGLDLSFNYRELSVRLKANFELPLVKQTRIEKIRANRARLQRNLVADTVVKRNYHLFQFGAVDWMASSSQTWNLSNQLQPGGATGGDIQPSKAQRNSIADQVGIGVGAELLYGEADVYLNYYDNRKFDNRQLRYLWRWVDNENPVIKQAQLGTISTQPISMINDPIVGAVIRNSPTTLRKAKGYHTIHDFTEANWEVELYINEVMVDHTKADAIGMYTFQVPNLYGYNTIKLKFYGPRGEERTEEKAVNVPYILMPKLGFEYGLAGGVVQDSLGSRFARGEFNFGVNRFVTIGGGLEYLSSITNGSSIPFLTATIQPFSRLTLGAEYAHGVKTRGLLNLYLAKNIQFELDYNKYVEGQKAVRFNAPEERRARLSIPFQYKHFSGYTRLDYTQLIYKGFTFSQSGVMIGTGYQLFGLNSYTQLNWIDAASPYITSDLILSYRFPSRYTLRPSLQYNARDQRISTYKIELEKQIVNGLLSVVYQRNGLQGDHYVALNFRYDLDFARTFSSVAHTRSRMYTSQSAQGSFAFGSGNRYTHKSNNPSVARGGISIYPFLDLNHNGKLDKGEPWVKLNHVGVSGSKVIYSLKDSIIRIPDLMPFVPCILEFKDNELENISWRFSKKVYEVMVDPNQFKRVNIPIVIVGEVNGVVYKQIGTQLRGMGRVLVKIYDKTTRKKVGETLSESDGFYSYLGMEPGDYVAMVDSAQLTNLSMTAEPAEKDFTARETKDGDIISNVDFVLQSGPRIDLALEVPVIKETKFEIPEQKIVDEGPNLPELVPIRIPERFSKMPFKTVDLVNVWSVKPTLYKTQLQLEEESVPFISPMTFKQLGLQAANVNMMVRDTLVRLPGTVLYEIRLFSNHTPVTAKEYFIRLLNLMPGLKIMESFGEDEIYHYTTGTFMVLEQAQEFLSIIKEHGWAYAKVTIYTGGKRRVITFKPKSTIVNTPPVKSQTPKTN